MKIIRRDKKHSFSSQHYPEFITEILQKRDIQTEKDFDLSLQQLLPFNALLNIEKATELIVVAILEQKDVLIVGDYDVDGATSIALAIRVLRKFGLKNVRYKVPHRIFDGYGLTRNLVNKITYNSPDLLITVDNGISNHDGVALAKEHGIEVIITDHHLPSEQLPAADAIVNPNLVDDPFASKMLAGVGVIFYVLLSVRAKLVEINYFSPQNAPNLATYLDLVALGTVSDVVPLDANNRRLVQQGLARIRRGKAVSGILSLIDISGRNLRMLSTSDIGFSVAPMLNAAGRLDDMTTGIECLLADDRDVTDEYARKLYALNQERRQIEGETREMADEILQKIQLKTTDVPHSICLYDESWHQGVTGIVASRIKDEYFRPTFVFAYDDEGVIKGSGRSIRGIHLRDLLNEVAVKHDDLIITFGGHAMAVGLTILEERLPEFQDALNREIEPYLHEETFNQIIYSDGELPIEAYNLSQADALKLAIPWGQGFPEPVFDDYFEVVDYRILKDVHLKMTLKHQYYQRTFDAIAFFQAQTLIDNVNKIHCAFKLDVNEWRGRRNLQLIVDFFEPVA